MRFLPFIAVLVFFCAGSNYAAETTLNVDELMQASDPAPQSTSTISTCSVCAAIAEEASPKLANVILLSNMRSFPSITVSFDLFRSLVRSENASHTIYV